jgi:hypothetical protein
MFLCFMFISVSRLIGYALLGLGMCCSDCSAAADIVCTRQNCKNCTHVTSCDQRAERAAYSLRHSALPLDLFTVVVDTVLTRSQLRCKHQRQHPSRTIKDGVRIEGLRKQQTVQERWTQHWSKVQIMGTCTQRPVR